MSGSEAVKQLSVAVAVFCVLLGAIYAVRPEAPMVRRQYPFSGLIRELGGIEENKVRCFITASIRCISESR
jgi:NADH dehydrogenase (ubiquinone) 1 beta subcomplex subunit 8